ncbi:MAG: uroporphyrinogen-III C-methyltransferase [Comamonadaceae bacterium]|nr:uroporphyrinogen-III C-methyltransferase [Comamonadaceae bacterium]
MLVAPEQAFFLRENLKLRLLNARLALLSRQFDTAQSDLRDAQSALDRYFDRSSRRVAAASELVRQVAAQARAGQRAAARRHAGGHRRRGGRPLRRGRGCDARRHLARAAVRRWRWWPRPRWAATTAWSRIYWGGWRARPVAQPVPDRCVAAACVVLVLAAQALDALVEPAARAPASGARCAASARRQAALREALAEYFGARYSRAHKAAQRALAIQADTRRAGAATANSRVLAPPAGRRQPAPPAGPHAGATSCCASALQRQRRAAPRAAADDGARLLGGRMGARRPRRAAAPRRCWPSCRPAWRAAPRRCGCGCRPRAWRASRWRRCSTARLLAKHQAFSPAGRAGPAALAGRRGAGRARATPTSCAAPVAAARRRRPRATRAWPRAPRGAPPRFGAADEARGWLRPFWDRLRDAGAPRSASRSRWR